MNEVVGLLPMARRLGLKAGWLKAEAVAGRLPCLRAGRVMLFNPDAVRRALARRAAAGESAGDAAGKAVACRG